MPQELGAASAPPPSPNPVTIEVMPGLGDAIYHRPYVRQYERRAWLRTRWPELFGDMTFLDGQPQGPVLRARYNVRTLAFCSVPEAVGRAFTDPVDYMFDLPRFDPPGWCRPYAIIRPPTLRQDFWAPARNPDARYIRRAAEVLRSLDYHTVAVGGVMAGEVADGDPPVVDRSCMGAQALGTAELMGAVAGADVIVAGPGWTVPAAVAYGVPHVVVYGGAAKWNALPKLLDQRMGLPPVVGVEPDEFCRACKTVQHGCNKHISDFDRKFEHALGRALCLRRQ